MDLEREHRWRGWIAALCVAAGCGSAGTKAAPRPLTPADVGLPDQPEPEPMWQPPPRPSRPRGGYYKQTVCPPLPGGCFYTQTVTSDRSWLTYICGDTGMEMSLRMLRGLRSGALRVGEDGGLARSAVRRHLVALEPELTRCFELANLAVSGRSAG